MCRKHRETRENLEIEKERGRERDLKCERHAEQASGADREILLPKRGCLKHKSLYLKLCTILIEKKLYKKHIQLRRISQYVQCWT